MSTLFQRVLDSEDGSVSLHGLLHVGSDLSRSHGTLRVSEFIESFDGFLTSILGEFRLGFTILDEFSSLLGSSSTEDDQIQEGVGTQTVSTMDGGATDFTSSHETRNDLVITVFIDGQSLMEIIYKNPMNKIILES